MTCVFGARARPPGIRQKAKQKRSGGPCGFYSGRKIISTCLSLRAPCVSGPGYTRQCELAPHFCSVGVGRALHAARFTGFTVHGSCKVREHDGGKDNIRAICVRAPLFYMVGKGSTERRVGAVQLTCSLRSAWLPHIGTWLIELYLRIAVPPSVSGGQVDVVCSSARTMRHTHHPCGPRCVRTS